MKATYTHINELFDRFNKAIFNCELPQLSMKVSNGARILGCFVHPRRFPSIHERGRGECYIRISGRYDMEPRVLEDTVIHEMIHYLMWIRGVDREPPHGPSFQKEMNRINSTHGRNITVRANIGAETRETDRTLRNNYICLTHWNDGNRMITVCARTCIFTIHRAWTRYSEVKAVEWYWSRDPWFNKFPLSRTPKAYRITDEEIESHIVGKAVRCVCDGTRFLPFKGF